MNDPSILIVEDEFIIAEDISRQLGKIGYKISGIVNSGEEAVAFVRRQPPSIVLMDIRLAGVMDGVTAGDTIRTGYQVPVIFLTANSDTLPVGQAKQAEPFGYLSKPFDSRQLKLHIDMALYKHDAERRLRESEERCHVLSVAAERLNMELEARVAQRAASLELAGEEIRTEMSQRRLAEEALIKSEARWHSYVEYAPYGVFLVDDKGGFLTINAEACRISGYTATELLSMDIGNLIAPDSLRTVLRTVSRNRKVARLGFETGAFTKNGEKCLWSVAAIRLSDELILGFVEDISERRCMELELEASRERYRTLVDNIPDIIFSLDRRGRHLAVNRACCDSLGLSENLIIGKTSAEIGFPPEVARLWTELNERVLRGETVQTEMVFPLPTGESRTQEVMLYPIVDPDGAIGGLTAISRDITEQRKIEAQLIQAQKLEAIGRLAGGLAHDFNNMLSVILGYVQLALMNMNVEHPLYPDLVEINNAARRSNELIRQLLGFARKQIISPKVLNLNETISALLKMLHRLIGEDIKVIWKPGRSLWSVKIDPSQIDQIITNLSVNARDAISGVGTLLIETENVTLDKEYCDQNTGFTPGDFIMLAVSDNGSGMDQETIKKIFEPFFTTKGVEQGTGLGLSTVYGIVRQNDGVIHVYSEPGHGSTFTIYFPRYTGNDENGKMTPTDDLVKGCGETILVVEDESQLLNLYKTTLEKLGYHALIAGTPSEAIALMETHSGKIDLLLTDVVMPEMNGFDLSKRILAVDPHIKCVFMSGYTANGIARHGVMGEEISFVHKPIAMKSLAQKLREVLSGNVCRTDLPKADSPRRGNRHLKDFQQRFRTMSDKD
jgi:two-component system, cell cycle sensor histidine kinase and response regulator CckA